MGKRGGKQPGAGRPKGAVAKSTLQALKAKELLIQMYYEQVRPINQALIDKALIGDVQAIKELHDRVYGKSLQPMDVTSDGQKLQVIVPLAVVETFEIGNGINQKTGGGDKKQSKVQST